MIKNKILIAGGSGNIGRPLCKRLYKNQNVTTLVNSSKKREKSCIALNLLDDKKTKDFINCKNKFDILIFLVGLAHKKGEKSNYEEFNNVNFITLKNLIEAFEECNKVPDKIIFTSTISIYGERLSINSYTENTIPEPRSPYAITKLNAENFLRKKFDSKCWILRLAPVYSEEFKLNISRRTKIAGQNFLIGNGKVKLSLCHLNNIISAMENIIAGEISSGTYNLADDVIYSYNDLHRYQQNKYLIKLPIFIVKIFLSLGSAIKNNFLIENSIKLISDNIYPVEKITKQLALKYKIK